MLKKIVTAIALSTTLLLGGCRQATRVNYNLRKDADNFEVYRRVIALNTRTNEALFEVEGYISIATDGDGDLNVTIKTGEDQYKLFYAHLSDSVTYASVQLEPVSTTPYAYNITFFPAKDAIEHGLVDFKVTN